MNFCVIALILQLASMSRDDPDYIPTPSQLVSDDSSDFDSDIDLFMDDNSTAGNFDMGITDLLPATQKSFDTITPRSTRSRTVKPSIGQFSISNILYGSNRAPATSSTTLTLPKTRLPGNDSQLEKTVIGYLANTVPENTLKKNQTALKAFRDFAKSDSTVQTPWEVMQLSRMPNALVRFVATKGKDYDQRTFHGLLGG